jgi:HEAT repeat protein
MCAHSNPRVRSKAVMVLGEVPAASDVLLEKVINDNDPRVRANAIEVLESHLQESYVPLLTERARSSHNRERANAIKAMGKMKVATAVGQLMNMMRDQRSEHRISALWALRQIGWWQLLGEVGRLAKEDQNLRVRRYALTILRSVAESVQSQKASALATTQRRKAV